MRARSFSWDEGDFSRGENIFLQTSFILSLKREQFLEITMLAKNYPLSQAD